MFHAKYPPKVSEDTVLSYTLSSPVCPEENRLTILKNGWAFGQKDCLVRGFEYQIFGDLDKFLAFHLPTTEFLELTENYYEISSDRTSGKASNLYYHNSPTNSSHWVGIWNYGRGDIPLEVDAGMYTAAENLFYLLMEESKRYPESSSSNHTTPWSSSTGFLYVVAIATAHSVFSNVYSLLRRKRRRSSNSKI